MRKLSGVGALLAVALSAVPAVAEEEPVLTPERFVYCTVCHGVDMGGNAVLRAPRLSGMEAWYLERQLEAFRKGWRGTHEDDAGGQEMRPMAANLSDDEIREAAAYASAVDSAPPATTLDGDIERGGTLYLRCAACHGEAAAGNETLASPSLTVPNDWYLLTQLGNFKDGIRGSHRADTPGLQMRAAAGLLPDEQAMKDVVAYIGTLRDKREQER